ncbi:MAG: hypothetical protein ACRBK7_20175, partial [Acidimicrobiales bacterium]
QPGTAGEENGQQPSGLLVSTHDLCWLHDPGPGHPESPQRLTAVRQGLMVAELSEAVRWIEAPPADRQLIERVHPPALVDRLQRLSEAGGGAID